MSKNNPESSGMSLANFVEQDGSSCAQTRPLSLAWIDDELLAETIAVWSEALDRPVPEEEAIEMLLNVKQMAEVLLKAGRETDL